MCVHGRLLNIFVWWFITNVSSEFTRWFNRMTKLLTLQEQFISLIHIWTNHQPKFQKVQWNLIQKETLLLHHMKKEHECTCLVIQWFTPENIIDTVQFKCKDMNQEFWKKAKHYWAIVVQSCGGPISREYLALLNPSPDYIRYDDIPQSHGFDPSWRFQ